MQSKSEFCQKNLQKSAKMKIIKNFYSINFDKIVRSPKNIIYLVYHYTGMKNQNKALQRQS